MKVCRSLLVGLFLLFALIFTPYLSAQTTTGRILGSVKDNSGGSVGGATVTVTDPDRGVTRSAVTDASGEYLIGNLAPGKYKVRVEAKGFKTAERANVELQVAKDVDLDFDLSPGSVTDTVLVTEEVPLLDTTSNTLGGTLSNKEINDLPLNGRDFQNLVTLRPGVQRYPGGGFLSISSNGNRPEDNNFIVDGIDGNDPYYATTIINAEGVQGTPASHLPIDAIQEFNAEENPPAEYGMKPGAVVNVGLKSGSNEYHGTVYYFGRNSAMDARNFFNTVPDPKKPLSLNQFGVTLGAPIIKDKLFYFVAYEGVRANVGNSGIVQTPATSSIGDPTVSIPDAIAHLNQLEIPVSQLSLNLLKLFPTNPGANGASLQLGFPNSNREDNGLVKIDWHPNVKDSISGRFFIADSLQTEQDIQVLQPYWESQAKTRPQVFGASWTRVLTPRLVNVARFGYNRFNQSILTVDSNVNPTTYGINTGVTSAVNFGMPEIAIDGFVSLGGNHGWPLLTTPNQTYVIGDDVSYTRGKHSLKMGAEFRDGMADNVRDRYGKSRIRFAGGGAFDGSSPLEDFLAGDPYKGRIFIGNSHRQVSMTSFGAYIQDDWRVSSHFTINAGLRYDLNSVVHESHNLFGNFDPNLGLVQVGQQVSSPYNGDHNNFGPRIGLVWDPTGKGKTVIRAGGSLIYEIPHISIFIGQNGVDNASTSGIGVIPTGAIGVSPGGGAIVASSNDFTNLNWTVAGPVFTNTTADCSASPCNILGVNRNLRTPYVTTWSLNVQQQLFKSGSLNVGYVGNHGTKLYSVTDINQPDQNSQAEIDCGHCEQAGRPYNARFPFLGVINMLSNGYHSNYDGLQASYTLHPWHGLSLLAGYTWAHALDQVSLNRGLNPQNSYEPRAEYATSDLDIRHRFTLSVSYQIPGIKSPAQLLQGWEVNSIFTWQTGLPWGVIDGYANGNDISLTGEYSDRWNFAGKPSDFKTSINGGIPFTTDFTYNPLTNTATGNQACLNQQPSGVALADWVSNLQSFGCFTEGSGVLTPPMPGTFGTMRRNLFRGPGYRNWDFSLVKNFTIHERFVVQFRGEFFNILNHPNFTNPYGVGGQLGAVDPSSPGNFGFSGETPDVAAANPVMGSGGPRAIQLGLKLKF